MIPLTELLDTNQLLKSLADQIPFGINIRVPIHSLEQRLRRPTIVPQKDACVTKLLKGLFTRHITDTNDCSITFTDETKIDYSTQFNQTENNDLRGYSDTNERDRDRFTLGDKEIRKKIRENQFTVFCTYQVKLIYLVIVYSKFTKIIQDPIGVIIDHGHHAELNQTKVFPPSLINIFNCLTPRINIHLPQELDEISTTNMELFIDTLRANQYRHQRRTTKGYQESCLNLTNQQFHIFLILATNYMLHSQGVWNFADLKYVVNTITTEHSDNKFIAQLQDILFQRKGRELPDQYERILWTCVHLPHQISRDYLFETSKCIPRFVISHSIHIIQRILYEQNEDYKQIHERYTKFYLVKNMTKTKLQRIFEGKDVYCMDIFYHDCFWGLLCCDEYTMYYKHLQSLINILPERLALSCGVMGIKHGYNLLMDFFDIKNTNITLLEKLIKELVKSQHQIKKLNNDQAKAIAFTVLFCASPKIRGKNIGWCSDEIGQMIEPCNAQDLLTLRPCILNKDVPQNCKITSRDIYFDKLGPIDNIQYSVDKEGLDELDTFITLLFTAFSNDWHLFNLTTEQYQSILQIKNKVILPQMEDPEQDHTHLYLPVTIESGDIGSNILNSLLDSKVDTKYIPTQRMKNLLMHFTQARTPIYQQYNKNERPDEDSDDDEVMLDLWTNQNHQ
jgi:hypothetical protein